jgi:hypothetical protein
VVSLEASLLLSLKKKGCGVNSLHGGVVEAEVLARVALSLVYCILCRQYNNDRVISPL